MSQAGLRFGADIFKWFMILLGGPILFKSGFGYIANTANPTLCVFTLPTSAAVGQTIAVCGMGTGLYQIQQGANQQIHYGNASTTIGVGGTVTSTNAHDTITLLCTVANLEWTVLNYVGIHVIA